jgi:hypothetical protein
VVLEQQDRQRVHGRAQGGRLLEDVDAVLLALDHPGDPAHLPLHPGQAPDQLRAVLGVAVAKLVIVRSRGASAGVGRRHRGREVLGGCAAPALSGG